jgi:hypothetical protein
MELQDVLQAILDKAGDKKFYIDVEIQKDDGEICGGSIRLCKVYEADAISPSKEYKDDRAGTVTIHERDETKTEVKPSIAKSIKSKLNIKGV